MLSAMARVVGAASILCAVLGPRPVSAYEETHNLTPDGYWHNRYHSLLTMASYGPYNTLCPNQTFTEAAKLRNFLNSTRPAWEVVNTFGPTPSGCEGFTAIVPEMNKALIVFKGSHALEQNLSTDVVPWSYIGLGNVCANCTVNRQAAQGYMECKNETNDWNDILTAYSGQKLVFSITGHGLGGMHSLIASVDLNHQNVAYYSHTQGAPRTFNEAGAQWYNRQFNGEAGERAISGNDLFTESIPASDDYAHAGTPFYYSGFNATTLGMNMDVCWSGTWDSPIIDDPTCAPRPQVGSTAEEDHYFYFTPVGQCGGIYDTENTTMIDAWLNQTVRQDAVSSSSVALASSLSVAASSSSVVAASLSSVAAASSLAEALAASQAGRTTAAPAATSTGSSTNATKAAGAAPTGGVVSWVALSVALVFGMAL